MMQHITVKQRATWLYGKRKREANKTSGGTDSVRPVEEEKVFGHPVA